MKYALVTGSSRGLGYSIAKLLISKGINIKEEELYKIWENINL